MLAGLPKRGRGRPRKYPPKTAGDFETTKYDQFFSQKNRMPDSEEYNMEEVVQETFDFIYKSPKKDKLFSTPLTYQDNPILNDLANNKEPTKNGESEKTCDEVFYEYLKNFKIQTNKKFFTLLLKFVLLFRECYDLSKNKDNKTDKKVYTNIISPEGLPDLCNEFYGEFMEPNNFFGIEDQDEKNEIIEIIQHFCIWLFKNGYTKSKLSLAS